MQQYRNWQPQEPEHHYDMRALVFGVLSAAGPVHCDGHHRPGLCGKGEKTAALLQPRHGNGRHDIGYYRDLYGCIVQYLLGL